MPRSENLRKQHAEILASAREINALLSDDLSAVDAAVFGDYMKNWQTTAQMRADPAGFPVASKAVFNALSKRIHFEHKELYPPFDQLEA